MRRNPIVYAALALIGTLVIAQSASAHDSGFGLARYTPDGVLDPSFGSGGVVVIRSAQQSFVANAVALQPDGRILIAGMVSDLASASLHLAVARYAADGTPDSGFGTAGTVATPIGAGGAQANAVAVEPDGKIVVAGTAFASGTSDDQFTLARYTADGSLDTSFGSAGFTLTHIGVGASAVQALTLQPDGKIVMVGTAFSNGPTDDDFAVARYSADGLLDPTFGTGGLVTTDFGSGEPGASASLDRAGAVGLEPDGSIVVAGFTRGDHQAFAVARYRPDGSLDTAFGPQRDGKVQVAAAEPQVYAVVIQPNNDIVVAGSAGSASQGTAPFALLRLTADGTPDETFGAHGLTTTSFEGSRSGARAVAAQADGKLLTGGAKFGAPSATGDAVPQSGFALARYNPDGSVDAGFGNNGRAMTDMGDAGATTLSLAVQPDGKIVAAGLVFFQVQPPVARAAGPFIAASRLAIPFAGLSLVVVALVLMLMVRGRRH